MFLGVSTLIMKSSSKLKLSDSADYLNLVYLPYCELYISDAHMVDSIKQFDRKYSERVMNLREFKLILKESTQQKL